MTLKEIMKYIESEYKVINLTPCEVCGGEYFAEELDVSLIDGEPFNICECVCSNCGHEKAFLFFAPYIAEKKKKNYNLN
jgi:hypothetical protein